jgi:endonuclease/exonuclease/phosphatase family metal-dependent hydrolase
MPNTLRLVTYNIRKGKGANGREKLVLYDMSRELSRISADLYLCQEVFHSKRSQFSQSVFLAEVLKLNSYYGANKFRSVGHHGNTTFTHLVVNAIENHDISTNRIERRGALYIQTTFRNRRLHVFNVHLGLNKRQRINQVNRLAQIILQKCRKTDPVILAGDFNDWSGRLDILIVEKLGFENAFVTAQAKNPSTWHARKPLLNLDRIYLRNLTVRSVTSPSGAPWSKLSDHLPLVAEVS